MAGSRDRVPVAASLLPDLRIIRVRVEMSACYLGVFLSYLGTVAKRLCCGERRQVEVEVLVVFFGQSLASSEALVSVSEAQDLGVTHSHRVIVDVRDRVSAQEM